MLDSTLKVKLSSTMSPQLATVAYKSKRESLRLVIFKYSGTAKYIGTVVSLLIANEVDEMIIMKEKINVYFNF
jgi:hypothetical protein